MIHLPLRLVLLFLALLVLRPTNAAFPLADLSDTSDYRLFPLDFTCSPDRTCLALISTTYSADELALNPAVLLSAVTPRISSETQLLARVHPRNNSVIWARAITDVPISAALDTQGNTYYVGSTDLNTEDDGLSAFTITKYGPVGQQIWQKQYNDTMFPLSRAGDTGNSLDFAGPSTLVLPVYEDLGVQRFDNSAGFVDTNTGALKQVALPLPNGPVEVEELRATAADPVSGVACFVSTISASFEQPVSVYLQCVGGGGKGKVVGRSLTTPMTDVEYFQVQVPTVEMTVTQRRGGGGAVVHVAVVRARNFSYSDMEGKSKAEHEMLVFKLSADTLEDLEWDTGRVADVSTMRVLSLPTPFFVERAGSVIGMEYLISKETLVIYYDTTTTLFEIEKKADGSVVFTGDNSRSAYKFPPERWLLYYSGNPVPTAVSVPYDPRPGDVQDGFNFMLITAVEKSADEEELYLYGYLSVRETRSGPIFILPIPVLKGAMGPSPYPQGMEGGGDGMEMKPTPVGVPSESPSPDPSMTPTTTGGGDGNGDGRGPGNGKRGRPGRGKRGRPGRGKLGRPGRGKRGRPGQGKRGRLGRGKRGRPGRGERGMPNISTGHRYGR